MADDFYIIKESSVERWSDDRAIGTLVVSGVTSEVAVATVRQARALFREFGARAISSKTWVVLSEELRRGNLGTASKIVMTLPKEAPAGAAAADPEAAWDPARIHAWTAETIRRTRRTDAYAHVQDNEAFYVATISSAHPVLGLVTARSNEILDILTLRAGRQAMPQLLRAFAAVLGELPGGVKPELYGDLKRRLYALTSVPQAANLEALDRDLAGLIQRAHGAGVLQKYAADAALSQAAITFCPLPPLVPLPVPDPLAPHRLTPDEIGMTRARPRVALPFAAPPHTFSRPRLRDPANPDDPRDALLPPVYGEEIDPDMAYARWTAVEWAPFIRPDRHSLFCHEPLRTDEGDRTKVLDVPGGYSLARANPKALSLRHISATWAPHVSEYWQPYPQKMQVIPVKPHTWVDMFVIETKDTDELSDFMKDLEKRVREELEKDSTKEKIQEAIEKGIDALVGDVTVFGVNVGSAAAGVSKLVASALLELVALIVDNVFAANAFQEVIVTHKTAGDGGRIRSWVTWGTRDRDTGEAAAYDPRADDLSQASVPMQTLSGHTGLAAAAELRMPGIFWESESKVPDRLPSEINPLFLLSNAAHGPIYWPADMTYGGHVFLPVHSRTGDGMYCLALRTEVRAIHITTP